MVSRRATNPAPPGDPLDRHREPAPPGAAKDQAFAHAADGPVADMIYWVGPEEGTVFHGGVIGAGRALSADRRSPVPVRHLPLPFGIPRPRRPRP